jgi:hypothetical protein
MAFPPPGIFAKFLNVISAPRSKTNHRVGPPFKTGRGMFAKYGQAPSAEEIDANQADMFQNFGEHF